MGDQRMPNPPRPGGPALRSKAAGVSAHAAHKRQTTPPRQPATVPTLQPRLIIGPADDPFEREAERTADVVAANGRTGAASVFDGQPLAGSLLRFAQRAPRSTVTDWTGPDKKDEDGKPRQALRSPTPAGGTGVVPARIEAGLAAMTGGGTPLAGTVRSLFESRFGLDFSDVRIHTAPESQGAAAALGARAFTVGEHIFFGAQEFQPDTPAGRHLLAHELTHTIQQKPGTARAARLLSTAQRVQRAEGEDDGILGTIRGYVTRDFPPWDLITLIIGYDPILERPVKGSTRDWMRAAMKLAPDGEALFEKLDKEGKIDAVVKWWDAEVAKLDLSYAGIVALFTKAWDAVSVTDVFDPLDAWETKIKPIFVPVVQRVWSFIKAVAAKVLQVVRDLVLQKLGDWAKQQRGYPLLTMVLGRDPVTGEAVTPTLKGVIFAVLDLVDGGDKIKENLEKSKAIEKAAAWFKTEAKKLDLTWEGIKLLFAQAWDAFQVADLLNPKLLLEKMWGIFGPPVLRLLTFVTAVGRKVLEFIFEGAMLLAGPIGLQIVRIVRRIGSSFSRIIDDPVAFVGHLVGAVKKGIQLFAKNIGEHLKTGLINWLVGTLEGAGLVLPKVWDLKGILDLVLQILGISYAKIRVKLVKVLGEKTVSMLETAFAFLKTIVTEGPAAAWKEIVAAIGSLWDMVIGGVQDWAVTKIVTAAVTKLATMLNPAGAVIQAIIATYNTIAFFIERFKQITDFVQAVVDSIANIAEGKIAQAAAWVEKAMGRTIPVILGFLARLIGLGDVSGAVKKVVTGIQEKVDKGIDAVIAWIVEKAKSLWGQGGDKPASAWDAAVAGVSAEADGLPEDQRNEAVLGERLDGWKKQYQFSELSLRHESGELIIEGSMSPKKKVKAFKEPAEIVRELKGEYYIQVKRGSGWLVGNILSVDSKTSEIHYTIFFPAAGLVTAMAKFSEYGKVVRKYQPGTEPYFPPERLAAENAKDLWADFGTAKKVLNYRAREDNDQSRNPSGMEWHHIHENKANPGGPNSVENLALTSRTNNAQFNKWFMKPQYAFTSSVYGIGHLEATGGKSLRNHLKEKANADLWKRWGYACIVQHGLEVSGGKPDTKGRWQVIAGSAG